MLGSEPQSRIMPRSESLTCSKSVDRQQVDAFLHHRRSQQLIDPPDYSGCRVRQPKFIVPQQLSKDRQNGLLHDLAVEGQRAPAASTNASGPPRLRASNPQRPRGGEHRVRTKLYPVERDVAPTEHQLTPAGTSRRALHILQSPAHAAAQQREFQELNAMSLPIQAVPGGQAQALKPCHLRNRALAALSGRA